ncbi:MAG TPA: PEGA domain-containing protein [Kofleriaceae bacterium]|nr:PEGA domain-containing protein [Kofleriaceae bacterium]
MSVALIATAATAHAERVIAMAPLSTLGAEDTSAGTRKLTAQIEAAIAALPGTRVVRAAQVVDAIKKARKPQLRACEGDPGCLTELASLVGAQIVISGEVGGLGDSRVVYLAATENGKELRSTTLEVSARNESASAGGGPSGAVVRLLDPDSYRGTLRFVLDVTGATIYVNGSKVTPSPRGEISLAVGPQAIRVTHPQYHDFVRFIDVEFGKTTDVVVGMQQYPIIEHDVQGKPINRDRVEYSEPPLWRRWYVVGPAAVGLAVLTAVVVGYAVHDFPGGDCRKVGGGSC